MAKTDFDALWVEATRRYAETSGKHFRSMHMPCTSEDLLKDIKDQNSSYKHFREKQGNLFDVLSAVTKPIELVGNLAAGAASIAFPPSQMCFGAVMYLINAAKGVSATLDAIIELLSELQNYTVRLNIYLRENLSDELKEKLADILTIVIDIFAQSTKMVQDGVLSRLSLFGKNVFLGQDKTMQGLFTRLDRLTKSENLLVGAENLVLSIRTNRAAEAVQGSVIEQGARLRKMSAGVNQLMSALDDAKDASRVERDERRREAVKKMLDPSFSADDSLETIKRDRVPDSGDWIQQEAQMQAWLDSKGPILWVTGGPGSGKSFLAGNIVTHLQNIQPDGSGDDVRSSIGYFFFRDTHEQTRRFDVALRTVAYQIARTDHVYAKHVENLSHTSPALSSTPSAWRRLFADFFLGQRVQGSSAWLVLDGIDEALIEDRNVFFDLLNDVYQFGRRSLLHVAMLGRSHVVEEMAEAVSRSMPTIHVDRVKTSDDIAHYVELSISKSRVLNRVSSQLKQLIIRTVSTKAEGMFLWAKLMIAELGKKSRESAIRDALNKAPAGLTQMLRHVLEGFSATLTEDDASDFNNILAWVTLAKRPLNLGELDGMLRLQSTEGDAVLLLESKLRKQYASLFTLTREDSRSTADLVAQKPMVEDGDDLRSDLDLGEGLDDVENETDFNSNPKTTQLSFSHAFISDFFRDPLEGKMIAAGGEHPAVGIDLDQARLALANTCADLIGDASFGGTAEPMEHLRAYARSYWKEHLDDAKDCASSKEKFKIGSQIVNLLRNENLMGNWATQPGCLFFTKASAENILQWLIVPELGTILSEDDTDWIDTVRQDPILLFEPVMTFSFSKNFHTISWLVPGSTYNAKACIEILCSWLLRKDGITVDVPTLSVELIERAASWPAVKRTADWHRRVGRVLVDSYHDDAAMKHFEDGLAMCHDWWLIKVEISRLYYYQDRHEDAIIAAEAAVTLLDADAQIDFLDKRAYLWDINMRIGESNRILASRISNASVEKIGHLQTALRHYYRAASNNETEMGCLSKIFTTYSILAKHCQKSGIPDITQEEIYEQVMALLHVLDRAYFSTTSLLVDFLHAENSADDRNIFKLLAKAAVEKQELGWLQTKFRNAMEQADILLEPVKSACLSLCLADLYAVYGDDEDQAARIWEFIGTNATISNSTAPTAWTRKEALNQLGQYLIRKALEDEHGAGKYVKRMESVVAKRKSGRRTESVGRNVEAHQLVWPHIQDAIVILSDDDPDNDLDGLWTLKQAFVAIGDDRNAFVSLHAYRNYMTGVAVINASKEYEVESDDPTLRWFCDGECGKAWSSCDGMIECRHCLTEFCGDCHQKILRGELSEKVCGREHTFVTIPYLEPEQAFKEGEVLIDGSAITVEQWKMDIEKRYRV